ARSICGLQLPVGPGITPGSGPGHLGLFGYDPLKYQVGRGVLSALGIGFDLRKGDIAARGNFCTVNDDGIVTDRRAGRIPTERSAALCNKLRQKVALGGVEIFIQPVKEYRFLLVLRGPGLDARINDTDPLETGKAPRPAQSHFDTTQKTARLINAFVEQAGNVLKDESPANMVLLRGFSMLPSWPSVQDAFGLNGVAIAMYPMYRGVARLVGMDALPFSQSLDEEVEKLEENWDNYDFFFIHVKRIDSAGEDGNFAEKVARIEEADALLPRILDLKPDVMVVTGDHSTPAKLRYHSWHPIPALLWAPTCRPDGVKAFNENACLSGGLGPRLPSQDLMPLMLGHAGRLGKFGA
ncbi:MAG: 2,3-bisphosphoglycerate-independent phosphoglycerate mutase, partial [Anaerolineae bacterium]|nr:2,3-bisphosphoglycerate-independent phosphoglycerate mutase [Anaerolineae bacterium]